jgi:hypothetical protein
MWIEDALDLGDDLRSAGQPAGRVEPRSIGVAQRLAQICHRIDESPDRRLQRLWLNLSCRRPERQDAPPERMRERSNLQQGADGAAAREAATSGVAAILGSGN